MKQLGYDTNVGQMVSFLPFYNKRILLIQETGKLSECKSRKYIMMVTLTASLLL
jgi:hypothetical protein